MTAPPTLAPITDPEPNLAPAPLRLPPCACPLAPVPDHSPGPHQESCTQYNALKLNAELFGRAPHAELADAFERKLLNGVMGIQRPHKPGAAARMQHDASP